MSEKFYVSPDWYKKTNIVSSGSPSNSWDRYAYGCLDAAKQLSNTFMEDGRNERFLVYPVIFLYRHYLELRLKEIIEHGSLLIKEEYTIPKHHDLMNIWHGTKKVIQKICPESAGESLERITAILLDFGIMDKKSDAFRYPIDTKGVPTLSGITEIDLALFLKKMEPAIADLEGMTGGISVYEEYDDEMLAEYNSYMLSQM